MSKTSKNFFCLFYADPIFRSILKLNPDLLFIFRQNQSHNLIILFFILIPLFQDSLASLGTGFGPVSAGIIFFRIPAHPRGAYIRGRLTPATDTDLLLTAYRGGSHLPLIYKSQFTEILLHGI